MHYNLYQSEHEKYRESKNLLIYRISATYHTIMFLKKKRSIINESKKILSNILRLSQSLVAVNKMNASQLLKLRADISGLNNKILELQGVEKKIGFTLERLTGASIKWKSYTAKAEFWIPKKSKKH